ncbi:signal peptidase I [Leucothrix arctica]|uniref:Signal peptidase I n=1 Tax=Leucothrix arctica TaxID=1481894 RepID=A0A317CFW6_9GAMM|nr:signal peptidase I [Leucothrix arctica]PWQ95210.1 signal peptidase I [Leucothrix arctica]
MLDGYFLVTIDSRGSILDKAWKPKAWIAIFLGVVLQSFTFLYLNRGKWFCFYFVVSVLLSLIDLRYQAFYAGALSLICPIHAYLIVRKGDFVGKRFWYSKWWCIPIIFISIAMFSFTVRSFFYEPFSIPQGSMKPTLEVGSHIWVSKLGYRTYGTYGITLLKEDIASQDLMERGQVYVFRFPQDESKSFVKRLIAVPGDSIEVKGSDVIVNGISLPTSLVSETEQLKYYKQQVDGNTFRIQHMKDRAIGFGHMSSRIVPKNSYFFLGDNRDNSNDSRFWGFVPSDNIVGKVVYSF